MAQLLITGAGGQLGKTFLELATAFPGLHLLPADRQVLDITTPKEVAAFFSNHKIDYCINCAAYTGVDKAESEPELAGLVNITAPESLAKACKNTGAHLIHFSTDYVYHSLQNTPFKEDDLTSPKGVYARTKLEGEHAALSSHEDTMVIRTSWVYADEGLNFLNTMLRLASQRPELGVVFDQVGTPTYTFDLAKAVMTIIDKKEKGLVDNSLLKGIYHYSNEGVASWYDFALAIFEIAGIQCKVKPIETKDYPTPAQRPPFSVLNKVKIKSAFELEIPHWREALQRCLQRKGYPPHSPLITHNSPLITPNS